MKFVWTPSTRRYHRTEREVKKAKLAYEVVEIETDKDSLIDRFNAYEERIEALQQEVAAVDGTLAATVPAPLEEAPAPPTMECYVAPPQADEADLKRKLALSLRGMEADAIEEKIGDSKGPVFARFLLAGIERLGVLGPEGWEHMKAFLDRDYKRPGCVDRGLRYLSLAQIADLDGKSTD